MSRPPNYEFQEWWNRERSHLLASSPENPHPSSSSGDEIHTPTTPAAAGKSRGRSPRQLSHLILLRLNYLSSSLLSLPSRLSHLLLAAGRRISSSPSSPSDSSRLYRLIRAFLVLSLLLLLLELAAYLKGWHFSPPSYADSAHALEIAYARWLVLRADYLAPPVQAMANVCIVLFLIQSVDRVVLMLGCIWIKIRGIRPVASVAYGGDLEEGKEGEEDYPMVLLQIPMCNEREVRGSM